MKDGKFGMLAPGPLSKQAQSWLGKVVAYMCIMQALLGMKVVHGSMNMLFSLTSLTGQVLGLFMIFVGVLGALGGFRSARVFLNAYIVGALLVMLLCFQFMSEVQREMHVDCELAELDIRLSEVEDAADGRAHKEMFGNMASRLDELDDMLTMIDDKAARIALGGSGDAEASDELVQSARNQKQAGIQLKMNDKQYITNRLQMIRDHANAVLEHPVTTGIANGDEELAKLIPLEQQDRISNRLDAAQKVLQDLDAMGMDGDSLTVEEYKSLLKALTTAVVEVNNVQIKYQAPGMKINAAPLYQSMGDMPALAETLKRKQDDSYFSNAESDSTRRLFEQEKAGREARRRKFREKFEKLVASNYFAKNDFDSEDLPEHCVLETNFRDMMYYVGAFLLAFQAISIYAVLTLIFRIPVKVD